MAWNEEKHPRKQDGKFTFSSGANKSKNAESDNPAEILYGKKTKEEKFKKERRNELLGKLGDGLTTAQTLYSSNEDLEKILNENTKKPLKAGLSETKINRLKTNDEKFEKKVDNIEGKIKLTTKHPTLGKVGTTLIGGPDTAGMLNLAERKKLPVYTKDSTKLMNINDRTLNEYDGGRLSKFKSHIEDKVLNQFKDFGYNLNGIEGRIFNNNSAPSKRIKESNDFREALIENKEKILKGESFTKRFANHGNNRQSNLYNAFGSVDFLNSGIDKDGNLHLYMFDTYDFNAGENPKVEAGRRQMLKGNLKGHFTLHDIMVTKDELNEIWNK